MIFFWSPFVCVGVNLLPVEAFGRVALGTKGRTNTSFSITPPSPLSFSAASRSEEREKKRIHHRKDYISSPCLAHGTVYCTPPPLLTAVSPFPPRFSLFFFFLLWRLLYFYFLAVATHPSQLPESEIARYFQPNTSSILLREIERRLCFRHFPPLPPLVQRLQKGITTVVLPSFHRRWVRGGPYI